MYRMERADSSALRAAGSPTTGGSGRRSEDAAADQLHGAGV